MDGPDVPRGLGVTLVVVGLLAAVVAAVAGLVLAETYRPAAPGAPSDVLPEGLLRSRRWSSTQSVALVVTVLASLLALLPFVVRVRRTGGPTRPVVAVVVGLAVAALAAVATLATRPLVEWEQVALRSVTVGTNISGYRYAATGADVRFVLVGGSEVSQAAYGSVLAVHLAAPVVGVVALVAVVWLLLRRPA